MRRHHRDPGLTLVGLLIAIVLTIVAGVVTAALITSMNAADSNVMTNAVVATVTVGTAPTGVLVANGSVWVARFVATGLLRDPGGGTIRDTMDNRVRPPCSR